MLAFIKTRLLRKSAGLFLKAKLMGFIFSLLYSTHSAVVLLIISVGALCSLFGDSMSVLESLGVSLGVGYLGYVC